MKVLVTGANGYIGSKVVSRLCDLGVEVVATDFDNKNIDTRANFIKCNIFEQGGDLYSFFGSPDICLHLAWRDGFVHNSDKHMEDLSKHYFFVKTLVDSGLKQIVIMGTMHEVGYHEGSIDENTPCNPTSMYGIAKNALRKASEMYCENHDCKWQWLRAFYIYGDDEFGSSIFCKIRQAVKEGKKTFPFTSGKNKFDFIHIDDLVNQISKCIMQHKVLGVINVCSGKATSLGEMVEWYITKNKLPISLNYGVYKERTSESPCIYGDNRKIKVVLNEDC